MKASTFRLGEILKEAGLLSSDKWEEAQSEQKATGKSMLDILKQDVNIETFKDLGGKLTSPFGQNRQKQIQKVLVDSGFITLEELNSVIEKEDKEAGKIGQLLVEQGKITEEQRQTALDEQKESGLALGRILLNKGWITPQELSEALKIQSSEIKVILNYDVALAEILTNTKILPKKKVDDALAEAQESGERLGEVLVKNKILTQTKVNEIFEEALNIPFVNINRTKLEVDVVRMVPENIIRESLVLPVKQAGKQLSVAMVNPLDSGLIEKLGMLTGCEIIPLLAIESALKKSINTYFEQLESEIAARKHEQEEKEQLRKRTVTTKRTRVTKTTKVTKKSREAAKETKAVESPFQQPSLAGGPVDIDMENIGDLIDSASTVDLVASIVESAINARSTDIHLEPQGTGLRVRYRIDGMLHDVMTIPEKMVIPVMSRLKILANMDVTERRRPQDGSISFSVRERPFDMRVATLPLKLGEKMVMRVLDKSRVLTGLPQLGLETEDMALLETLIYKPYGMILVTGPIGSGKTTTLYSALNEVNVLTANIVTIEDPVEYQLPGINQIEVDHKVDMTFAAGLRAILRQDANILMVGEIRDAETAAIAVRAANTGHLVLSTLHTNDSASALTTLMQLGVPPFLITGAVIGVVAQRLVRKICDNCKSEYEAPESLKRDLSLSEDEMNAKFFKGEGCEQCFRTGYHGRKGIYEILEVTPDIKELILRKASDREIKDVAIKQGMSTLAENVKKKVLSGETTIEEAMRVVYL